MRRALVNSAFFVLVVFAVSCGGHGRNWNAADEQRKLSAVSDTACMAEEVDTTVAASEPEAPFHNPFFTPYMEIEDLIDAEEETLTSPITKDVDFGGRLGRATLTIQKDPVVGLKATMKAGEKTHVLFPMDDTDGTVFFLSACAYDLDGDGQKELMVHDGDLFSLRIFQMSQSGPRYVGSLRCNWGFFVTDDRLIVSMMGSQGGATRATYAKGRLKIIDEEFYIDKVMRNSLDFLNLRYQYDDNETECHVIERIYPADRYIICDQESIYGNNCFSVDLDGDGSLEQLFLSRPGWGATSWDEMRVILPGTRTSYSLTGRILEDGDPRAVESSEFDWHFSNLVQLSAKDVDGDGKMEIVASLGSREDHVDYVWSFDRNDGPKFIVKK